MKNLFLLSTAGILAAAVTGCTCCGNETVTPCSTPAVGPAGFAYESGVVVERPAHHKKHHMKHHKHHVKHHHVKHHHMPCPEEHKAAAMPKGPAPMPGAMPPK
jgi:hypothetical protein